MFPRAPSRFPCGFPCGFRFAFPLRVSASGFRFRLPLPASRFRFLLPLPSPASASSSRFRFPSTSVPASLSPSAPSPRGALSSPDGLLPPAAPRRRGRSPGWPWASEFFLLLGSGLPAIPSTSLRAITPRRGVPSLAILCFGLFGDPSARCDRAAPGRRDGREPLVVGFRRLWAFLLRCRRWSAGWLLLGAQSFLHVVGDAHVVHAPRALYADRVQAVHRVLEW